MENNWIVVGIAGATCGGKTTIANELHRKIPNSVLIHQDSYYYPVGSPMLEYIEEINHYNWDTLSAIDTERFVCDIKKIVETPSNSSKNVLIVEGHLIFNISIRDLCNLKYFVIVSKETSEFRRLYRKYKRYDKRYFHEYAWPLYEFTKEETFKTCKNLITLDGELESSVNCNQIINDLRNNFDFLIDN